MKTLGLMSIWAVILFMGPLGCNRSTSQPRKSIDGLLADSLTAKPTLTAEESLAELREHVQADQQRLVSEITTRIMAEDLAYKATPSPSQTLTTLDDPTFRSILELLRVEHWRQNVHLANLANLNTPAYKKLVPTSPVFDTSKIERLSANDPLLSESFTAETDNNRFSTRRIFHQGAFIATSNPLDLALEGNGFFQLTGPDGESAYSRCGTFGLDSNSGLVLKINENRWRVEPPITIPSDATSVVISCDGTVHCRLAGQSSLPMVGVLQLALFTSPENLNLHSEGIYLATEEAGIPKIANPGTQGAGLIRQGYLESSNVEPQLELVEINKSLRTTRALKELLGLK